MKKVISILLTTCMVFSLAACGDSNQQESNGKTENQEKEQSDNNTETEEELVIWLAGTGDPAFDKTYDKVFDAFVEEHPGVKYEKTFIPWTEYFSKLNTGIAGGAAADLFMLGYGQMGTVQSMDYLLPLDDYIPEDWDGWDDFLPNIIDVCKNDGKMYALFAPSTRVYMYRKDIAEQQGVTEEDLKVDSYDELVDLAHKLTVKDDNGNIQMSGLSITTSQNSPEQQFLVNMTYVTDDARLWNDDYSPHFNSPDGKKAMQNLVDLYESGVSLPSDPNDVAVPVASGLAAMSLINEANYSHIEEMHPGNIGILDCSLGSLLIGNYMSVNKDTKVKQLSVDMLLHMFSKESCKTFAEGMGQYSGRKSLDDHYISINPEEFPKIIKAYEKSVPLGETMNPYFNKMITIFRTAMEEIYAGADPGERLDQAAEEYVAAMNES